MSKRNSHGTVSSSGARMRNRRRSPWCAAGRLAAAVVCGAEVALDQRVEERRAKTLHPLAVVRACTVEQRLFDGGQLGVERLAAEGKGHHPACGARGRMQHGHGIAGPVTGVDLQFEVVERE
ncbi:MAG: hypothetical protein IPM07_29190 [Anaerolineales bacterium]|nr:hypothetical protein [Anaerolineales bacterium]